MLFCARILTISVAIVTLWIVVDFDSLAVMTLHVLASVCAFVFAAAVLRRLRRSNRDSVKRDSVKMANEPRSLAGTPAWTRAFVPFYGLALLQIANISVDVIVLGIFQPDTQVGIYRISAQLASLVSFGLLAINPILHGRISKSYAEGDVKTLQSTTSMGVLYMVCQSPFFILMIFGQPLLGIYGSEFAGGYAALRILLTATVQCDLRFVRPAI